ncbi:hypothetical protein HN587_06405 [Candidatus Woesearchaeota archaeon]|nr:hypothetical protein [Candidatus Woesearchaeota archaeon]
MALLKQEINPMRITIFPNYNKFRNNYAITSEYVKIIKQFRKFILAFADQNSYVNIHQCTTMLENKEIAKSLLKNPILVRSDLANEPWEQYTSTSPSNSKSENKSVLAFGGWNNRKPYSYITDKFEYRTINSIKGTEYELICADINYY